MHINFGYVFLSLFSAVSVLLCLRVLFLKNGKKPNQDFKAVIYFIICLDVIEFSAYQFLAFGYSYIAELLAGMFLVTGSFFVTSLFIFSANLAGNELFEKIKVIFYLPGFLIIFLHSQNLIVTGFVINDLGMLHKDGPLAYIFDINIIGYLLLTLAVLMIFTRSKNILLASRSRMMLFGFLPLIVMILLAEAIPHINVSVVLPLLTIYLLLSLDYITSKNIINISVGLGNMLRIIRNLLRGFTTSTMTLNEYKDIVEKEFILSEIKKGGSINDIAERLDIHSTTFRNKLKKYGISPQGNTVNTTSLDKKKSVDRQPLDWYPQVKLIRHSKHD